MHLLKRFITDNDVYKNCRNRVIKSSDLASIYNTLHIKHIGTKKKRWCPVQVLFIFVYYPDVAICRGKGIQIWQLYPEEEGIFPILNYMGRLHPIEVPFYGCR